MNDVQKLLGPWTLQSAIVEREEKEATLAWALKENDPFKAIPPMRIEGWPAAPLHVLRSQLWQLIASYRLGLRSTSKIIIDEFITAS
jgi:hypothetical protein